MTASGTGNSWDAQLYDAKHAFVYEYGRDLVALLAPRPGERILDVGCGTGHLTQAIAAAGAHVVGIDASAQMIARAAEAYPVLEFIVGDARSFRFERGFDAVFSNAALHWIHEAGDVVRAIARALLPGGRFVAEFGARDNVRRIIEALAGALERRGRASNAITERWYFPSIGEYATVLEAHGLEPARMTIFERPTALEGAAGLRNWLAMFAEAALADLSAGEREALLREVEEDVRPVLLREGTWYADYRRLRLEARRR